MQTVAAFDFDGTITTSDSLYHFIRFSHSNWVFVKGAIVLSPMILAFKLGLIGNQKAKEITLKYFFGGFTDAEMQVKAQAFAEQRLPELLRPKALQKIRWHKQQGHRLVLVSASIEACLRPWAKAYGFDDVCSSRLEVQKERLTGRLVGKNCYGPEKVARLEACVGPLSSICLYAYGDTRGDYDMLALATYPAFRVFE